MAQAATIGKLDEVVAVEEYVRVPDGSGGFGQSWATLFPIVFARVKPLRASEGETRGAVQNVKVYMFTIYQLDALTEAMRFVWNGNPYNIREIRKPGSRELTMDVIADSGVAQ